MRSKIDCLSRPARKDSDVLSLMWGRKCSRECGRPESNRIDLNNVCVSVYGRDEVLVVVISSSAADGLDEHEYTL